VHAQTPAGCEWFQALPDNMHDEQKDFLAERQTGG
jgi:hypothetical protein